MTEAETRALDRARIVCLERDIVRLERKLNDQEIRMRELLTSQFHITAAVEAMSCNVFGDRRQTEH